VLAGSRSGPNVNGPTSAKNDVAGSDRRKGSTAAENSTRPIEMSFMPFWSFFPIIVPEVGSNEIVMAEKHV